MAKTVPAWSRANDATVGEAFVWFDQYDVNWAEVTLDGGEKLEPQQIEVSAHKVKRVWIEKDGQLTGEE